MSVGEFLARLTRALDDAKIPSMFCGSIASTYYVHFGLLGQLLEQLGLLHGGFNVYNLNPGEIPYELGLRYGDIPLSLNGKKLEHHLDLVDVFEDQWVKKGKKSTN